MKKSKQLTKSSEKILESIRKVQNQTLVSFKTSLEALIESASSTLKKVESDGTSGYYSTNSDYLKYSENCWRHSLRLCELKLLESDIEKEIMKNSGQKSKNDSKKHK